MQFEVFSTLIICMVRKSEFLRMKDTTVWGSLFGVPLLLGPKSATEADIIEPWCMV